MRYSALEFSGTGLIIVAALLSATPFYSDAATDKAELLNKIKPINANCDQVEKDVSELLPNDKPLSDDKIAAAIELLKKIDSPNPDDLKTMTEAMQKDTASSLEPYIKWVGTGCRQLRFRLRRALFDMVKSKSLPLAQRQLIFDSLKLSLNQSHTPTLLDARMEARTLELANETALWKKDPNLTEQIKTLNARITAKIKELEKPFDKIDKIVQQRKSDPEKLRADRRFNELKGVFLEEIRAVRHYLDQVKTIVSSLEFDK